MNERVKVVKVVKVAKVVKVKECEFFKFLKTFLVPSFCLTFRHFFIFSLPINSQEQDINKSVDMKDLTLSLFAFCISICILHFAFCILHFPPKIRIISDSNI